MKVIYHGLQKYMAIHSKDGAEYVEAPQNEEVEVPDAFALELIQRPDFSRPGEEKGEAAAVIPDPETQADSSLEIEGLDDDATAQGDEGTQKKGRKK
ncbi:MAG: hypothetical protein RI885_2269 [Actinomycetota bacterium]|jgi:hypothetical protein